VADFREGLGTALRRARRGGALPALTAAVAVAVAATGAEIVQRLSSPLGYPDPERLVMV
jgi:hypothetical protein